MGLLLLVLGALWNQPHKPINTKLEHLCLWPILLSKAQYSALNKFGWGAFTSCMFFVILQEQRTDEQRSEARVSDLFVCLFGASSCSKKH